MPGPARSVCARIFENAQLAGARLPARTAAALHLLSRLPLLPPFARPAPARFFRKFGIRFVALNCRAISAVQYVLTLPGYTCSPRTCIFSDTQLAGFFRPEQTAAAVHPCSHSPCSAFCALAPVCVFRKFCIKFCASSSRAIKRRSACIYIARPCPFATHPYILRHATRRLMPA